MLFLITPVFAFLQLRLAGERINQISLVNVTVIALVMFSVIGTLPLFYFLDDYRYSTGVQDQELVVEVLFYSCVNLIFFLFGVIFIRNVVGLHPVQFVSLEMKSLSRLQKMMLLVIFFCGLVVLFNYLMQVDQIAIFVALNDGVGAAKQVRSDMGNSFGGKYHWYKLVMHDVGNVITFTAFGMWLFRKNIIRFFAFLVTFSFSVFVAVMATEKAPFAWLLIGLFMVYFLVRSDGLVPFRNVIVFALIVVSVLVVAFIFFMGSYDVRDALWSVFSRAFSGSISPAYFYLEFFPDHQDYLLGRTFPNPGGLMPYEPYRYTIEVMNWKFPSLIDSGIVGTAPTVFWGEAYANFGPIGIPIVAFIVGGGVALFSYFVSKIEISPLSVAFFVWLILIFKDLAVSGFSGYLYNVYIILVGALVVVILSARGYFKVRSRWW